MKKSFSLISLIVFSLLAAASVTPGQVSITTLGAANTQNFDAMTTADFNLTDNTSIPGVYAFRTAGNAVPNVMTASVGNNAAPGLRNFGSTAAADRALGSIAGGPTGTVHYGVRFANNTGSTIASIEVTYAGEQWRNGGIPAADLAFDYRQAATVTDLTTGTYTLVPALNFTTPVSGGTPVALDGNAAANRSIRNAGFPVTVLPGQEIMIRWTDFDQVGNDHGVSIDNLTIIARSAPTAAGASISGRVVTANGRGIGRTYITLSGSGLTAPVVALTNPFGHYKITDIAAGQTYVLSIRSKTYRFDTPLRTVNLGEDLTGLDFVAEP